MVAAGVAQPFTQPLGLGFDIVTVVAVQHHEQVVGPVRQAAGPPVAVTDARPVGQLPAEFIDALIIDVPHGHAVGQVAQAIVVGYRGDAAHDAGQAQALKAMTRRAEAAEARAEAEKGAREAAEARSEAEKGAREAAERKLALQEGAELSAYELYGLYLARLGSQTEGAVQTEGAGATAEAAQAANLAGRARRDAARDERVLKRARRNGLEERPECAEYRAWQNSPHTKGLEARAETAEANLQKIREDSTDWANAVGATLLLLKLAHRLGREPTKEEVK